jgi:hypothetical protein
MSVISAGRIEDMSVRKWITKNASKISELPFVLISSIDSQRDLRRIKLLASRFEIEPKWALSIYPLVISGTSTVDLANEDRLFTGFDEIWIPRRLPISNPPSNAYLVAPREIESFLPLEIENWVESSECRLGVGDGDGLNYVVLDDELGRQLQLV